MSCALEESDEIFSSFSGRDEMLAGLKHLRTGKASGLDIISTEMIKHFGDKALDWLLLIRAVKQLRQW